MKIKLAKKEIIHFIGIGGIGMSGLALIMKGQGFKVQGSDIINNKNVEVPFMILALTGTEKMVNESPATTFIDKSIRVQDVKKEINSEFHFKSKF